MTSINLQYIDCYCSERLQCSFPLPLDFYLFYDGAVDMQIRGRLTRRQCIVSDTMFIPRLSDPSQGEEEILKEAMDSDYMTNMAIL